MAADAPNPLSETSQKNGCPLLRSLPRLILPHPRNAIRFSLLVSNE